MANEKKTLPLVSWVK